MRLVVDTGVLGRLCNPRRFSQLSREIERISLEAPGTELIVPEVVDYELRRKLLHLSQYASDPTKQTASRKALMRLDKLGVILGRAAVTESVAREAAQLWAEARGEGRSTAHEQSLDIDVIVAAHCKLEQAEVLTLNKKHLERYGIAISSLSERFAGD